MIPVKSYWRLLRKYLAGQRRRALGEGPAASLRVDHHPPPLELGQVRRGVVDGEIEEEVGLVLVPIHRLAQQRRALTGAVVEHQPVERVAAVGTGHRVRGALVAGVLVAGEGRLRAQDAQQAGAAGHSRSSRKCRASASHSAS